jgi:Xaa-Pro aminopeptidase
LIERSLLRDDEVKWLNAYHAEVRRRVGPYVRDAAATWLQLRTEAI